MHRYPFSCVSVGLTIGKEPVVGVVLNPILGETYTAGERGLSLSWGVCLACDCCAMPGWL